MNAAGPWASSLDKLQSVHKGGSGAVVTKTFTIEPASGNEEPNQYFSKDFSINSVGLSNKGSAYFISAVSKLGKDKPIIASVAEESNNKILELVEIVSPHFDGIELNLSCPNIKSKEPLAYSLHQLDILLEKLFKVVGIPVGLKLPPYITRGQIANTAAVLRKYPINHIVLINTYPLASILVDGEKVIMPNDGVGGLGGKSLKPIALAHVILFKKYMPDTPIIGVGGIETKEDVRDFIKAGASAVQVGTALHSHGLDLLDELSASNQ